MDIKITEKQREKIIKLLTNRNPKEVFKLLGGVDNFLKLVNNDFKEFYEITGYVPYTIDNLNGGRMLIDEILIDSLNLEDRLHWSNGEKQLGFFIFGDIPQRTLAHYKKNCQSRRVKKSANY